jgi:hypothetical protein
MIPQAVVAAAAVLTLTSDTAPVTINVNKPRGTVYWGGAGLDGSYIADQLAALQEAGIEHMCAGTRSYGMEVDAMRSASTLRYRGSPVDEDWSIGGMENNRSNQFNMIGYSYGSLLAAQTAHFYAHNGHIVDNLVLIGCPIDQDFLDGLDEQKNIRNIAIKNLREYGDPIFAGMSQVRLSLRALIL